MAGPERRTQCLLRIRDTINNCIRSRFNVFHREYPQRRLFMCTGSEQSGDPFQAWNMKLFYRARGNGP